MSFWSRSEDEDCGFGERRRERGEPSDTASKASPAINAANSGKIDR